MSLTWNVAGWDAPARRKLVWAGLLVSLAANAFFVGAMVTDVVRFGHIHDPSRPRIMRTELKWIAGRLSPQSVAAVERQIDTLQPEIAARFGHLHDLRAQLDKLVAAPTPDRMAIDQVLSQIRLEFGALQAQIQSKTFDAVLALPASERAALAAGEEK